MSWRDPSPRRASTGARTEASYSTTPTNTTTARSAHTSILFILATALALRLLVSLVLFPSIQERTGLSAGSDGYESIAETLIQGAGYRFAPDLGETMFLLPVYPLFLAGLFSVTSHHLLAACIAQSCLDTMTCFCIYYIASASLGNRVALTSALLYALYPGSWIACSRYLTEPLFVFLTTFLILVAGRFLLTGRRSLLFWVATSSALAVLCKSVAALLPVFLLAWLAVLSPVSLSWRRRIAPALACLLGVACAAAPWSYRNFQLTGTFVFPSTSGGLALYTSLIYATHPRQGIRQSANQAAREVRGLAMGHGIPVDPRDGYPRWFSHPGDELAADRLARRAAWEGIVATPRFVAKHIVGNLWRFWIGAPTTRSVWIAAIINLPLLILACIGLVFARPWRQPELGVWLAVSAYLFCAHVAVLAVVRYSLTVMPLICMLAATPLTHVLSKAERGRLIRSG